MDMQYKYMAVFFYGISLYTGTEIVLDDEEFKQLLLGFIMNYYLNYTDLFNKIFDIKYVKNKGFTYKIDYDKIDKYGSLLDENPKKFCKMYDEIGWETIEQITELSNMFCEYANTIYDINNNMRIRH